MFLKRVNSNALSSHIKGSQCRLLENRKTGKTGDADRFSLRSAGKGKFAVRLRLRYFQKKPVSVPGFPGFSRFLGIARRFQLLGTGYDPLVTGGRKIVPSIGNVFGNRQTVYVYFQIYGAEADAHTQKPALETYLMLLKDDVRILESKPQRVEDWTKENAPPAPGARRATVPGGMPGRQDGNAKSQGPAGRGAQALVDRKGEATVAISLPLKNLKKGTYTLQIHVHDLVADVNLFQRVPIVIQ